MASRAPAAAQPECTRLRVFLVDIDGDGKRDLVSADWGSSVVSVFRNLSAGGGNLGFASRLLYGTDLGPGAVRFADFDRDGRFDLATANRSSHSLSVLRNLSSPEAISFAPTASFGTNWTPKGVVVGDFNSDGKLDLVSADEDGERVSLPLNTESDVGTVSFATTRILAAGDSPIGVVAADFNGDELWDLATANTMGQSVSVLPSSGPLFNRDFPTTREEFPTTSSQLPSNKESAPPPKTPHK